MSSVPQGPPGASHIPSFNPNPARRTSYASVAAGISGPSQQTASVHLPPATNQPQYSQLYSDQLSRIPRPISAETQMSGEESTRIPETWGSGARVALSSLDSSTFSKHVNSPWDVLLGGGTADGFFKPTYLAGSKYMEELEAAHKESLEEKEEPPPNRSGRGSFSKSSSSVNLPKMQASHRGMAYEIIEHQPPVIETGPGRLPSKWAHTDRYNCIEIAGDGQQMRYVGNKLQEQEAAAARADRPMPNQAGIYYYEVTIISKGKDGMIGIGFSGPKVSLEKLPGWEPDSWAYHGDDGKTFACDSRGKTFGPTFSTEDTIGCGVNFMDGTAFFTKNGNFLGSVFREIKDTALHPSVGMKRPHAHIMANFGQRPFIFDIDTYVEQQKRKLQDEIQAADISSLYPALKRDDLCTALVAQYLSHDGYVDTARAFSEEIQGDNTALTGKPESSIDEFLAVEDDRDAANRQRIRAAVLEGDIDRALHLSNTFFPKVLATHHEVNFRVRCRKYIEMMQQAAELLHAPTTSPSKSTQQSPNGHSTADPDQAMDLDDQPPTQDGFDSMDTSDTTGRPLTYTDVINRTIVYGRELRTEFNEEPDPKLRQLFSETMEELFGMWAYKDPRESPASHWLGMGERAKVAEALNSAILVTLGKSPSTALERIYKQTIVFTDMISEDGGPGSLINFRDILKQRERNFASSSNP